MNKLRFGDLPLLAKIAVGVAFYDSWVLFEETVIDRQGLSRYLPLYEVGCFCVWDVAAILAISGTLVLIARRSTTS